MLLVSIGATTAMAEGPAVRFDAPALVGVQDIGIVEGHESVGSPLKTIEVVIPVSSEIAARDRQNVDEFRFDVYWNRNVYPLADYAPRTQTVSDIVGAISVETNDEKNAGIGVELGSDHLDVVSGSLELDLSQNKESKLKYQQVPQHDVLVASGTIHRGTGAFFRFHPSKRETLEGGRDLVVAFRVPQSWRGGVIKVECRAMGRRKIVGSWREPFEESRAFVLPIYLEGDDQARHAAEDFVRSEQGLRQFWQRHQNSTNQSNAGLFGFPLPSTSTSKLPESWVHHLIQSGHDDYLNRYRSRLPNELANAADQFVIARRDLFKFSR